MSIYNFTINEQVVKPTSESLKHEAPSWKIPNWREIEAEYANAAKGYTSELDKKEAYRLCSYMTIYARPSRQSIVVFHSDKNQKINSTLNPGTLVPDKGYPVTLTGTFIDMPDGRWHYVQLPGKYSFNTIDLYQKFKYRGIKGTLEYLTGVFKFGFVREDFLFMPIQTTKFSPPADLPCWYNYEYSYYENGKNGYSYLYMLMPRYDPGTNLMLYPVTTMRVTAYPNQGNTKYIQTLQKKEEQRKNDLLKYSALGAGAFLITKSLTK